MEPNKQQAAADGQAPDFKGVKERLHQIAEAVEDPELSLDAALDLYEEAVALGLQASDLLEVGITEEETRAVAPEEGSEASAADGAGEEAAATAPGARSSEGADLPASERPE